MVCTTLNDQKNGTMRTSLMQVLSTSIQGLTQKSFSTSFSGYPRWNCSQISTLIDECKSHLIKWRLNWFEWILFWVTCRRRFWERCHRNRAVSLLDLREIYFGWVAADDDVFESDVAEAEGCIASWSSVRESGDAITSSTRPLKEKNCITVGIWNLTIRNQDFLKVGFQLVRL